MATTGTIVVETWRNIWEKGPTMNRCVPRRMASERVACKRTPKRFVVIPAHPRYGLVPDGTPRYDFLPLQFDASGKCIAHDGFSCTYKALPETFEENGAEPAPNAP